MKKIIVILIVLFSAAAAGTANAQLSVVPYVDERTELMSIVFRLAGAEEYSTCYVKDYANDIDTFFDPYKDHDLIKFIKKVRMESRIGSDAVMSLAVHLEFVNQKVRLKDNIIQEDIDVRWTERDIVKFIKLLNRFYKDSEFHTFFERHSDLYRIAGQNFNHVLENVDFGWFERFFGVRNEESFSLIISFVNGLNNYGHVVSYTNKPDDLYAIMGTWTTDKLGEPIYPNSMIGIVVHEFNHSFCNLLIDEFYPQLEQQADALFMPIKDMVHLKASIFSKKMLYEILVRACVIKYFESLGDNRSYIKNSIAGEFAEGFLWIEELVDSLSIYEQNRDKYPTLRDYMPEIVKLQNSLSPQELFEKFSTLKTKN